MLNGYVKIQLGLFYIVELIANDDQPMSSDGLGSAGYAVFDLQHQQLSQVFMFFSDVLMAAKTMPLV
jgi:hypothetical protein